tara:strand:- start:2 stop:1048 length:1047 start_codon:yes stop_codon:yes gene_type:complete
MDVVIITGSCGLVGSEAVNFFSKKNYLVVGIDNNKRKFFFGKDGDTSWVKKKLILENKNYKHFNIDISNKKKINKIFKYYHKNIKLIIHAAGQPSHDWAIKNLELDFQINSIATLDLLMNFKNNCPKASFVFLSTNKVYGDNPNKIELIEDKFRFLPKNRKFKSGFDENLKIDNCTHSFFGASKLSADVMVQEFGKNLGLNTVCFRAGCITGTNHSGAKLHGFLSYLVKAAIRKKKYQIIGYKGKQVRDNIHSYDLVNCIWHYFKKPKKGVVYNIGGGLNSNCSVLEALNYVEKKISIKVRKEFISKPRTGDHIWYISDISKFKGDYKNCKFKFNLQMILDDLINNEL